MRYTLRYPIQDHSDPRLVNPSTMVGIVRDAERLGFDAVAFTEHPAPSAKWLALGGHETLDPLTALTFVAAATERLRLMTYLLVLPYRNPLLAAKQATTVDVLSDGRLTMAIGVGYLRSEFAAMGVDFEERNELFDEAAEAMIGVWTTPQYRYEGRHFLAVGQTQRPLPVQRPHPPLWIGGNSRLSRRRAARYGQGWTPVLHNVAQSETTRTQVIIDPAGLAVAVAEMRAFAEQFGRDPSALDVQAEWAPIQDLSAGPERPRDAIGQLAEAGATWTVFEPDGTDADQVRDQVQAFGETVIAPETTRAGV
jgi:probable F420-dependent oxidoreductase